MLSGGWADPVRAIARTTAPIAPIALTTALGALSAGCGALSEIGPSTCDRSDEENALTLYTEGTVEAGVYMSASWDCREDDPTEEKRRCELLYFPGGMRYRIEHRLGATPRWWHVFLSFDRYATDAGTLAQAAGNEAEVREVSREHLDIANGSCAEYWLLVVAGAADEAEAPVSQDGPP
jgi:hypothetical protein